MMLVNGRFPAVVLLLALVFAGLSDPGRSATLTLGRDSQRPAPDSQAGAALVEDIQRRLNDIGLYSGPIDGKVSPDLRSAIEEYQRQSKLPVDGLVSEALKATLDDASLQAKRLLRRLEEARLRQIKEAREALAGSTKTQELMATAISSTRFSELSEAQKTHCLGTDEAACLVAEALEALVQVTDSERRDWVLARLATFEALLGDPERAVGLITRASDPRLIVEGLQDIAWAVALKGEMDRANQITAAIPLLKNQASSYLELATVATARDDKRSAEQMINRVVDRTRFLTKTMDRIDLLCGGAVLLHKSGLTERSQTLIDDAVAQTEAQDFAGLRDVGYQRIVTALLDMKQLPRAMDLAGKISPESHMRGLVSVALADALIQDGRLDEAADLARSIDDPAQAVTAISRLAEGLKAAGKPDEALQTVNDALAKLDQIRKGPILNRARMTLAITGANLADKAMTRDFIDKLSNSETGARAAWTVSRILTEQGDVEGAAQFQRWAEDIALGLPNPFEQAWVYSELAVLAQEDGNTGTARRLLYLAVDVARGNTEPWFRARALARVATTSLMLDAKTEQLRILRTLSR